MKLQIADAIIIENNKLLLVQQAKKSAYGLWSFPGGKIEEGESPLEAVHREVEEELGIKPTSVSALKCHELTTPTAELELYMFLIEIDDSIILKKDELLNYGWFSLDDMRAMQDELRHPVVLKQAEEVLAVC
jgi:8-oxo-dGTP diphosphatase